MKKNAILLLLVDVALVLSLYFCKKNVPTIGGENNVQCIECIESDTLISTHKVLVGQVVNLPR